jgi:hypothetical protein
MNHRNEPPGNIGVTLNGREVTEAQAAEIRKALRIALTKQVTLKSGEVLTVPWGNPADVLTHGTEFDVVFDFVIPEGRPGIDGIGSVDAVEAVGVPFGQAPDVINFGTPERAKLRFFVPAGPRGLPGQGVPANPVEGFVVGFKDGIIQWVPQATTSGGGGTPTPGGGTTIINNIYNVSTFGGAYPWEDTTGGGGAVPAQFVLDSQSYAAYQSAIAAAPIGSKRAAGASSIISTFGNAQKLTLKRNGVTVLVANYSGPMTQATAGADIQVVLQNLGTVSDVVAADNTTGTWTLEVSGGATFARTMTFTASTDLVAAVGDGFNPGPIAFVLPRSLDGQ